MNLIQPMLNSFPPHTWSALAGSLNETPERTRQGLFDALPVFFAGLIGRGATTSGAAGLLSLMRSSNLDLTRVSSAREGLINEPNLLHEGGALAHSVLGDNFDNAAGAVARHAGVGIGTAQSLLGLAAPLALGGIARNAPAGGFTPESLTRFLQGQRDDVVAAAPQGLSLSWFDRAPAAAARATQAAAAPAKRGASRVWPWLIGLGAVILFGTMMSQCTTQRVTTPTPAPPAAPRVNVPDAPAGYIDLPNGVRLNAAVGTIGRDLATFLSSGTPAPRTFTFNDLNFDTGDIVVTPESTATLNAIASTLAAYPNAGVRLDGYTDNVGERAANMTLSQNRANAVAQALVARGVDASRISTAGFGPDNPVASNDTEAGRAQNRRLELTVTRK